MDPWEVLDLDRAHATPEAVRDAMRRLAKLFHPDVIAGSGGDTHDIADASGRLAAVNRAVELALADLATRPDAEASATLVPMPAPSAAASAVWAAGEDAADATFSLAALPVEAFELVLLAFSCIGDPKVIDEPYLLEGQIDDPFLGHARVELAPEAGGSQVTVTTAPFARATTPAPTAAQVAGRLLWEVRNLGGR